MRSFLVAFVLLACSSAFAQSGASPFRMEKAVKAKSSAITQPGPTVEAKGIRPPRPVPPPPPPMMGLKAQWMD